MLNCSVFSLLFLSGVPAPIVKWMKDGGDSFPAAIERRLHVKANDDNLYVVNVSLADTGIYTCRVSNEAGHVESSAHILVYGDFSLLSVVGFPDMFIIQIIQSIFV